MSKMLAVGPIPSPRKDQCMRKIPIVLLASAAWPCVALAVCCSSLTSGPTAWAPTSAKAGCGPAFKATYGGTTNVQAGAENIYMTTVQQTAKLYQTVPGRPNALVASRGPIGSDIRCNANTGVALLTTTPTCAILKGKSCFTR